MKTFKTFCEQAFHPDLVNKLSNPEVQKNLKSTIIPAGQRYASGPPPMTKVKPEIKSQKDPQTFSDYARGFVGRLIRNTGKSPL